MIEDPGPRIMAVAIGIVIQSNRVLICRRKKNDSFGGYWELPGGKCEKGETPENCVRRELREELDIEVTPVTPLDVIEHRYSATTVQLNPFLCRLDAGDAKPLCASELQWVSPAALREYRFPPANAPLIQMLATGCFAGGAIDLPAPEA